MPIIITKFRSKFIDCFSLLSAAVKRIIINNDFYKSFFFQKKNIVNNDYLVSLINHSDCAP